MQKLTSISSLWIFCKPPHTAYHFDSYHVVSFNTVLSVLILPDAVPRQCSSHSLLIFCAWGFRTNWLHIYMRMYVCTYILNVFLYIHPLRTFGSPVRVMHPSHLLLRTVIHHSSIRGNFWKSGYLKNKIWEVHVDMDLGAIICEVGGALSRSCFCRGRVRWRC